MELMYKFLSLVVSYFTACLVNLCGCSNRISGDPFIIRVLTKSHLIETLNKPENSYSSTWDFKIVKILYDNKPLNIT